MPPEDPPPPPEPPKEPPQGPPPWWMIVRPPLFASYWLLVIFAWIGVFWLTRQLGSDMLAVIWASLITAVVAGVLRENFTKDPPYRF